MEFYDKLYIGYSVSERVEKIKEKLLKNEFMPFIHIITLPIDMGQGMLEIYPAYILRQESYQSSELKIVGIAADRGEAYMLVQQMAEECMKATGTVDLKNYLKF